MYFIYYFSVEVLTYLDKALVYLKSDVILLDQMPSLNTVPILSFWMIINGFCFLTGSYQQSAFMLNIKWDLCIWHLKFSDLCLQLYWEGSCVAQWMLQSGSVNVKCLKVGSIAFSQAV